MRVRIVNPASCPGEPKPLSAQVSSEGPAAGPRQVPILVRARRTHLLRGLGTPDLEVVEVAVLASDTEFDLRLGGVADAGGPKIGGGLPVQSDAHRVAHGLHDERVPPARFQAGGISDLAAVQQAGYLGPARGVLLQFV